MRRDTKIAIVVAFLFIGLGAWYVLKDKFSSGTESPAKEPTAAVVKNTNTKDTKKSLPMTTDRTRLHQPLNVNHNTATPASPLGQSPSGNADTAMTTPPLQGRPTTPFGATPSGLSTTSQPAAVTAKPTLAPPIDVAKQGARATPGTGEISLAGSDRSTSTTKPSATTAVKKADNVNKTHVVQAGDTFTAMAVKYYGHAKHTSLIAKANPNIDPRKLRVGAKVTIPPNPESESVIASPAAPAGPAKPMATLAGAARTFKPGPVPADRAYTIKPGEGWYTVAQQYLGDGRRWTELYELNKERVPHNPHSVPPGTVIELPKGAKIKTLTATTSKPA